MACAAVATAKAKAATAINLIISFLPFLSVGFLNSAMVDAVQARQGKIS
jgi:hypothetical protein